MTTVVFVHGTGVRKDAYNQSFDKIASRLSESGSISAKPCYWGHLGSELHAGGASIPDYDSTRALGDTDETAATSHDYSVALWGILYEDPLYELRVLALRREGAGGYVPGQLKPGAELANIGKRFEITPDLQLLLQNGGIAQEFEKARSSITDSAPYREALERAPTVLSEYRTAIARAFIAKAVSIVEQKGEPAEIARDAPLRDETARLLFEALGGGDRGISDWVKEHLGGMVLRVATWKGMRNRGATADATTPAAGDILLYQARGQDIRSFIRERIMEAAPPRVLLAHSLGGIACVDLLVTEPIEVQLLVTVGSQAPFFYEINALQSLPYGEALPRTFPRWLNIYDLRDFLSYKGAKVFQNRVKDVKVNNGQPFHWSHSAYWSNNEVWKAIKEELQ